MDKQSIRKEIRLLKKGQTAESKRSESEQIWSILEKNPLFQNSHNILIYWSMNDEVETPDFIRKWQHQKQFLLPCVVGDELEIKLFNGDADMLSGDRFQIPEPKGEAITNYDIIELAIVPGVAFDKQHQRLGRGRGYYDKTLCKIKAPKIGVCFSFQYLDEIPTDGFDVPMDDVIHA